MADEYVNKTGLTYYHNKIKDIFASKDVATTSANGLMSSTDKTKLNGVASGAEVNVQSDWNESSSSSDAYISNKPTKLSDFTNDGDGTAGSAFATEDYADAHGGKIDKIKVNSVEQTITNKTVDISVPTATSDLTNDGDGTSNFATLADVSSAVSSVYKYKGSVADYAHLPSSGNTAGDVWDTQDTGANYAWTGTAWDSLGTLIDTSLFWAKADLTAVTTAEIDTIVA